MPAPPHHAPAPRPVRPAGPARLGLRTSLLALAAAATWAAPALGAGSVHGAGAIGTASEAALARPVVYVQAGHEPPGEPGYRAQTGAGSGPFGSEVRFTTRTSARLIAILTARGVDARPTPALVTPFGVRAAVFISIHHDAPGGSAAVGHAITGAGENWYHGEGFGAASPTPYPDSAAHRSPTSVSARVERVSRDLAVRVGRRYGAIHTRANGAGSRFGGVVPRDGNVRMMRFYGYYRTRADARVLIECGAAGADDGLLARTDLIARTIASGVLDHLRSRRLLAR